MKKLCAILGALIISTTSFSQSVDSKTEEIIPTSQERIRASEGTYQLVFKNEASKEWFFSTGIKTASKYVGVAGIVTYSDLLIVIGENRLQSKEQEYIVGENKELEIRVLSLDYVKSSKFQPLEEIIIKK
ncbi:MAG: hypothetical protein ACI857_000588 [Arenicella sp.]|jgi:hypothetical protein